MTKTIPGYQLDIGRRHVCEQCGVIFHCDPCTKRFKNSLQKLGWANKVCMELYSNQHRPNGEMNSTKEPWFCDRCSGC